MIERDPISGNEVPPGGKPEEVRDDIDAKLSDGEYVLPADVVRFYGVQHIEKMVQKAKEGMGELVANGRVNGEEPAFMADPRIASRDPRQQAPQPVPRQMSGGGYNFLPQDGAQPVQYPAMELDGLSAAEELRKRQEAPVEMADGGYASAAQQIMGNQSYGTAANQLLNTGGVSGFDAVRSMGRGFYGSNAVGGTMGGSAGGVETRTYINKNGERISIMFINGTPIANIPDGYVPDTPEGRKQFEQAAVGSGEDVADPGVDEDGRDNRESNNWGDEKTIAPEDNYFGMSGEQLMDVGEAPKGLAMKGLAGMGIAGAAVGAINAMKQGEYLADIRARATAARELGHTEAAEALDKIAADFAEEVPQAVKWAEKLGGVTGEGILKTHANAFQTYTEQQVVENTWLGQNGSTGSTGSTGGTTGGVTVPQPGDITTGVLPERTPGVNRFDIAPGQQWTLESPYQKVSGGYRATDADVDFLRAAGANDLKTGDHLTDIEVAMLHNRDAGLSLSNDAGLDKAQAIRDVQRATNTTPTWSGEGRDDRERTWDGGAVAGEEGSRATSQSAPSASRTAEEAREAAQRAADNLGMGLATGGRAKGGLVSRKHSYRVPRRKIRTVEK